MSITTVPLRPIRRGVLVWLWIGIAVAALLAVAAAWAGTSATVAARGTPEQFLAWNSGQPGVVETTTGLQYQVIEPGEGDRPTDADVALVGYKGELRDGTVFDQNERAPLPVGQMIPGFSEGMKLMPRGAKYRFWIPPALGYGASPQGDVIPADAVLIFEVEMIDFIPAALLQQMQQQQMQGMPGGMPPGATPPGQ